MAKKSKTESEKKVTDMASGSAAGNGNGVAAPRRKTPSAPVKPKAKRTAAKKTSAPASRAASKKASPPALREPTDEEIRIRAYFLAERRIQLSLPGDSAHDWIEARRQLIEESGPASS